MHLGPLGSALLVDVHLMVVGADGDLCGADRRGLRVRGASPLPNALH